MYYHKQEKIMIRRYLNATLLHEYVNVATSAVATSVIVTLDSLFLAIYM